MNNMRRARILTLPSLFLIMLLLLPAISTAQNKPTHLNLENTEWLVTTMDFYSPPNMNFVYLFGKQGNVGYWFTTVITPGPQTVFNVVTQSWETKYNAPTIERVYDLKGIYRQDGNSVRLEFSDHIINATIKGNRMEGEATSKVSNKKAKWAAETNQNLQKKGNPSQNAPSAKDKSSEIGGNSLTELLQFNERAAAKCLPKEGMLIIKMKDGSIRRIDLSQAKEITVEP